MWPFTVFTRCIRSCAWAAVLLLFCSSARLHAYTITTIERNPLTEDKTLSGVILISAEGKREGLQNIIEKPRQPILFQFIFTSCSNTCPVLSASFRAIQGELQGKAQLVSISIDPEHDTPAILKDYASRYDAQAHWNFYTGSLDDIVALQKLMGVYQENKMRHQPVIFLQTDTRLYKLEGLLSKAELLKEFYDLIQIQHNVVQH